MHITIEYHCLRHYLVLSITKVRYIQENRKSKIDDQGQTVVVFYQ